MQLQTANSNLAQDHYKRLLQFIEQKQNVELRQNHILDLTSLNSLAAETVQLIN